MKTTPILIGLVLGALGLTPARAIVETHTFSALNLDIPDGNPSGLANVQNFATTIGQITDVTLSLQIIGTPDFNPIAYNGDLYAYVVHDTGFSILLNRVGRAVGNLFGYSDNGFDITFDDDAPNGDVHIYQTVDAPDSGDPLLGLWQPDARTTDPNLVLTTDPRSSSAMLSTFNTLNAVGDWTLFVADLAGGEEHRLASWSLTITGNVPEPSSAVLLTLGVFGIISRRWRRA